MGHPLPVNLLVSKIVKALTEAFIQLRARWHETPAADKTIDNLTLRLIAEEQILKSYHTSAPASQNNNLAFNAAGSTNNLLFILTGTILILLFNQGIRINRTRQDTLISLVFLDNKEVDTEEEGVATLEPEAIFKV